MDDIDQQLTQDQTAKVVDESLIAVPDGKLDDEFNELKYHMCKYCKGIIAKFPRKNVHQIHCAKICSETNKMIMNDNYVYIDSATFDISAKEWSYYKEVLREKAAPPIQKTNNVLGLESGMKLEALDMNNPVNFCVATVIKIVGHRLCIRYDGFGADSVRDFWCNFQAEELFPIGWCAQHGYALQPPTGIKSTLSEWKAFLTRTLTGALAAPPDLFRKAEERRQLRCHPYQHGNKIEVIHPQRPDLIVSATVSKSLGPYYYLVQTDPLPGVPTCYFYGYADSPGVYTCGWCETRGLKLSVPTAVQMHQETIRMIRKCESSIDTNNHGQKRSRLNPFKIGQKVEAVDGIEIQVATVAEVFGRVAMLVFDGTDKKKFVDKNSFEVFPIGWCEQTGSPLKTPYGRVNFHLLKGVSQVKYRNEVINSASFSSFQESMKANVVKIISKEEKLASQIKEQRKEQQQLLQNTKDPHHQEQQVSQPEKQQGEVQLQKEQQKQPQQKQIVLQQSTSHEVDIKKQQTAQTQDKTKQQTDTNSEVELVDLAAGDIDMESPLSPRSPTSRDKQKSDMEHFIVWLMNNYDYDQNETECIVKPDLNDHFTSSTNIKLSPRWFSLIYKLFPGVSTVRRSVDGKFVNCFRNLKEIKCEKAKCLIYVKDAVEIMKKEGARVILSEEKIVGYMGIGDNYVLPEDTKDLFTYGEAKPNSRIFVIYGEIAPDFRVVNFRFAFEKNHCSPPLQKLSTVGEFHAMLKLSKQARLCKGVAVVPKADNTTPNYRQGKFVKNGRLYSPACNKIAFSYKMFICSNCKSIRTHNNRLPSSHSSTPTQHNDSMEITEKDDVEESTPTKEDEDNAPSPDIKIFFNKSCYPGIYLDSAKVMKMSAYTDLDRPAQTLKRLVERLIDVSLSKEKLLEIIEAGFGTRIFNKSKDKVVKKGLFRFNTRRKIIRFLKRLTKRLHCCEYFLLLDPKECIADCKKTAGASTNLKSKQKDKDEFFVTTVSGNPNNTFVITTVAGAHTKLTATGSQARQGAVLNNSSGNLQLLYQLPVVSTPSSNASTPSTPNTPRILVQTPDGLRNRFPQGTQFFVPSNGNNLAYMVVCKENVVSNVSTYSTATSEIRSPTSHAYNLVSSPSAGVTQMMANISKANLVSDIDDPTKVLNRMPQISVVKGGTGTNQIIIKKSYDYADKYVHSDEVQRPKVNPITNRNTISPPTLDDVSRKYHYSRIQTSSSFGGDYSQYESHSPSIDKGPHIHVQNVLHGNARVKYVDVKPMDESSSPSRMQNVQVYRKQQQSFHYSQINQHLTVHTPGHSPRSPLHSPPALRPPPPVGPPRPIALSSPPSLVPSPEICPRFDYIKGSSQAPSSTVHSPVQVANLNSGKPVPTVKPIHIVGNQNITLPRLPSSYQLSPLAQPGNQLISRGKVTAFQAVRAPGPVESSPDNRSIPGSSSATTTVTMAYIPIQTSTKDKLYYVPVQSSQGQPMVLYQNNQPLKDSSGKSMIIPQQTLQKAANMAEQVKSHTLKDQSGNSFTTVRIQGVPRGSLIQVSQMGAVSSSQPIPLKAFKYQFGQAVTTVTGNDTTVQPHITLLGSDSKHSSETIVPGHPYQTNAHGSVKSEPLPSSNSQCEIMTIINDQLRRVPPNIGIHNSDVKDETLKSSIGQKRDINGMLTNSCDTSMNEENSPDHTIKKRRGRPPAVKSYKSDSARSKLSLMQVNPLSGSPTGNPITLANRVLTETFYKKQQQLQNRANFLSDPLAKLPHLPSNPDNWTPSEVHTFLLETDCASYANLLRDEEIDGKSFLLMTREALMEFMGMRLGPALKIAGHASYLRARQRMQNLPCDGQTQSSEQFEPMFQPPKEKKSRVKKDVICKSDREVVKNEIEGTTDNYDVGNDGSSLSIGKPMDIDKKLILEVEEAHTVSIEDLNQSVEIPIDIQIDSEKPTDQVEQFDASDRRGNDTVDSHFSCNVMYNTKSFDSLETRKVDNDIIVCNSQDNTFEGSVLSVIEKSKDLKNVDDLPPENGDVNMTSK